MDKKVVPKKIESIIWLSKQGLYLYIQDSTTILTYPFTGDCVKYFDIIDSTKLSLSLTNFFKQNNAPPLEAHLVIGPDAIIEKEFESITDEQMKDFLDLVPYEKVFSKKVVKVKSTLVCAFNAEFYYQIEEVLEKFSGQISTVTPYFTTPVAKFDPVAAQSILKNLDLLKNENMINYNLTNLSNTDDLVIQEKPKVEKSTLPILLPVFFLMLVVLAVVYYLNLPKPTKSKLPPIVNIVPTPIANIVTPTVEATKSASLKSSYVIKISYNQILSEKANLLKSKLLTDGYSKIQLDPLTGLTSSNNVIVFKPKVDVDTKQEILKETNVFFAGTVTREDQTINSDIDITITK